MDPNEALAEIRSLSHLIDEGCEDLALQLAGQIAALDEWLSQGGFLPRAWQANRVTL